LFSSFIRAASMRHYPAIARRHGLDPRRMIAQAGIPLECLRDPELLISVTRAYQLLEDSAEACGVPTIGLEMGEANQLSTLGLLGLILREEPTLRAVLQTLMHYRQLHNEALTLRLEETGGNAILYMEYLEPGTAPVRQAIEQGLAMMVRTVRALAPAGWQPRWIGVMHGQLGPAADYQRVLAAPVRFNAEFNGLVFAAPDLDRQIHADDPALARQARERLDQLLAARGAVSTVARVRELATVLLPLGRCSIEQVAQHLGLHRVTLHRQLQREGSAFGAIRDEVRRSMAVQLMASRQRSLAQVAAILGFSSPPAFSRWHRQSFGASAQSLRRQEASLPKPPAEIAHDRQ
jgi:AraC-like DNA-binding protein